MALSFGSFAEQIRSAVGRSARAGAWGAFLNALVIGTSSRGDRALEELADRIGAKRSRAYQTLMGSAGFWLTDVHVMEPAHSRAVLEMLAEVLGYRVSAIEGMPGTLASHVEVVQSATALISQLITAAADGSYSRAEATDLRAVLRRMRASIDAIDQLLAEAEVHGERSIA